MHPSARGNEFNHGIEPRVREACSKELLAYTSHHKKLVISLNKAVKKMPTNYHKKIDDYVSSHIDDSIEDLARLCAIRSVSEDRDAAFQAVDYLVDLLSSLGFTSKKYSTPGNPIVIGEAVGRSDKTLLFYLHYDVQAADPLDLWESPPFELTQRQSKLYARGAADDKGQIVSRLAGLSATRAVLGDWPCNIKFIIEGEEEEGSPNLGPFIHANQSLLAADACVWEYGGVNLDDVPVQSLGMRGICYVDFSVRTANQDIHSGLGGSIFPNAAWRLVWALNSLKDADEQILIPGFYDDVEKPSELDLELLDRLPDEADRYKKIYGLNGFLNNIKGGLTLKERAVFQPSCTICGLDSGYQANGTKTIVPAEARAKIDFRLVPNQDPDDIIRKLRQHLNERGFGDIAVKMRGSTRAARTDPDHPFVRLSNQVASTVYGEQPIIQPLTGGSGPSHLFIHTLNLPVVTLGVAYPGSQIHSPNEHIRVQDFELGIRHVAYLAEAFARS